MQFWNKVKNIWFNEGAGVTADVPDSGPERMWFVVKSHYMELLGINLLFLVFCLPVVTIPGALSGITKIIMKWLNDEPVFFWEDFYSEFKAAFGKRLLVWFLLMIAPISLALYAFMFGQKNIGLVILLIVGEISVILQAYLFPIFVTVDIPVGTALKDAAILFFLEWKTSLYILFFSGVLIALCGIFTLYAIPVIVICLVSLYQLTICLWVNKPIQKLLIKN